MVKTRQKQETEDQKGQKKEQKVEKGSKTYRIQKQPNNKATKKAGSKNNRNTKDNSKKPNQKQKKEQKNKKEQKDSKTKNKKELKNEKEQKNQKDQKNQKNQKNDKEQKNQKDDKNQNDNQAQNDNQVYLSQQVQIKKLKTTKNTQGKITKQVNKASRKSQKPVVQFKKGKFNLLVPFTQTFNQQKEGSHAQILECCIRCQEKELIRLFNCQNYEKVNQLLSKDNYISSIFANFHLQDSANNYNVMEQVLINKDQKGFQKLMEIMNTQDSKKQKKAKKNIRNINYGCYEPFLIQGYNTGYNNRFAYGYATRRVNQSRGGKEGNAAFLKDKDISYSNYAQSQINLLKILKKHDIDFDMMQQLLGLSLSDTYYYDSYLGQSIKAGNFKMIKYMLEALQKQNYHCLNKCFDIAIQKQPNLKELATFNRANFLKKTYNHANPILVACMNPYSNKAFQEMLTRSSEFYYIGEGYMKLAHYAALSPNPDSLAFLLKNSVSMFDLDGQKNSPFMMSCSYGRVEQVRMFIKNEKIFNYKHKNRSGMMGLHLAVQEGYLEVVKELWNGKMNMKLKGVEGKGILHIAAYEGYLDIVEYILDNKIVTIDNKDKMKRTPLIHAVMNGHSHVVNYLLSKGCSYDLPDSSSNYPIHYAAAYGYKDIMDMLIQAGANINIQNSWNYSALLIAYSKRHSLLTTHLLSISGIDVNCIDNNGQSLLMRLSVDEASLKLLETLLSLGPKINHCDMENQTVLSVIISKDVSQQVDQLIDERIRQKTNQIHINDNRLDWQQRDEKVQLMAEKEREQKEELMKQYMEIKLKMVDLVMMKGSDINIKNKQGQYLIQQLINKKEYCIIEMILEKQKGQGDGLDQWVDLDLGVINDHGQSLLFFLVGLVADQKGRQVIGDILKRIMESQRNVQKLVGQVDKDGHGVMSYSAGQYVEVLGRYLEENRKVIRQKVVERKAKINKQKQQDVVLNLQDNNEIDKEVFLKKLELEEHFYWYLQELIKIGVDINQVVQKLSKYRDAMEEENPQQQQVQQNNQEEDEDEEDEEEEEEEEEDEDEEEEEEEDEDEEQQQDINIANNDDNEQQIIRQQYSAQGLQSLFYIILPHITPSLCSKLLSICNLNVTDIDQNTLLHNFINSLTHGFHQYQEPFIMSDEIQDYVNNSLKIIRMILNKEENEFSKTRNAKGNDLIHLCARKAHWSIIKILIDQYQFKIDICNKYDESPLSYWVQQRNIKNTKILLQYFNADPNYRHPTSLRSSLHFSVNASDSSIDASFELESILLQYGADVNLMDKNGRNCLFYAFIKINQYQKLMEQHCKFGANEKKFKNSHSVLQETDPIVVVSGLLQQQNIEVEVIDKWNRSVLHYAGERGSTICGVYIIKRLQERAVGDQFIDLKDKHKNTAVTLAFLFQRLSFATMILQKRCNITNNVYRVIWKKNEQKQNDYIVRLIKEESLFELAILQDWQGVAYLLIQEGFPLLKAIKNSMIHHKFQLGFRLLSILPYDVIDNMVEQQQNNNNNQVQELEPYCDVFISMLHLLTIHGNRCDSELLLKFHSMLLSKQPEQYELDRHSNPVFFYAIKNSQIYMINHYLLYGGQIVNQGDQQQPDQQLAVVANNNVGQQMIDNRENFKRILNHVNNQNRNLLDIMRDAWNGLESQLHTLSILNNCYDKGMDINMKLNSSQGLVTILYDVCARRIEQINDKESAKQLDKTMIKNIEYLKSKGYDLNQWSELTKLGRKRRETILLSIVLWNNVALVKYLLDLPDELFKVSEQYDNDGNGPLYYTLFGISYGSYWNKQMIKTIGNYYRVDYQEIQRWSQQKGVFLEPEIDQLVKNIDQKQKSEKKKVYVSANRVGQIQMNQQINQQVGFVARSKKELFRIDDDCKQWVKQEKDKKVNPVQNKIIKDPQLKSLEPLELVSPFSVLLSKTDIQYHQWSLNVFYKMQIYYQKVRKVYVLYTRWGRTGYEGQSQVTPGKKQETEDEFVKIFKEKTGMDWSQYQEDKQISQQQSQQQQPQQQQLGRVRGKKKYKILKVNEDYGQDRRNYLWASVYGDIENKNNHKKIEQMKNQVRKLRVEAIPIDIEDMLNEFCQTKHYNQILQTYRLQNLVNLQQIDRQQLLQAKDILYKLQCLSIQNEKIKHKRHSQSFMKMQSSKSAAQQQKYQKELKEMNENYEKIVEEMHDLSNEYYMCIPNCEFGENGMECLYESSQIDNERRKIDGLMNVEIAQKMRIAGQLSGDVIKYLTECLDIKQLNSQSSDWEMVQDYLRDKGSSMKGLFKVDDGKPKMQIQRSDNCHLLWHGTSISNCLSILYQGLKVAPEGLQHGSMFGTGIYFADNHEKAMGYCNADSQGNYYLLLCEVKLGEINEFCRTDEFNKWWEKNQKRIYDNIHLHENNNNDGQMSEEIDEQLLESVKGMGRSQPDNNRDVQTYEGVKVQIGSMISQENNGSRGSGLFSSFNQNQSYVPQLNHNEYIVYTKEQVQVKYIVKINQKDR